MVRANDIQEKLLHLIGWEQNYDTSDLKISDALTVSESGLYFQQIHPLLTLQNMSCIAPDFKNITFPEYNSEKEYSKGNVVDYQGTQYKALQKAQGKQPDIESEYWVETNLFSEWLESKTKASIQKAIARYCNEKTVEGTNKPLCESRTLFDGTGRLVDTVKNKKNLVGFEIVPVRAKGVTAKINKICLQFTKAGEYTLYLMHSSMDAPVKIIKLIRYEIIVLNGLQSMTSICHIKVKIMMQEEVGICAIFSLNFQREVKLLEKIKTGQKSPVAHARVENYLLGWHGLNILKFIHSS